jgi:hypothetical protein
MSGRKGGPRHFHDHNTGDNSLVDCAGRFANLAVQPKLGLLPKQRTGAGCSDPGDSLIARANLDASFDVEGATVAGGSFPLIEIIRRDANLTSEFHG